MSEADRRFDVDLCANLCTEKQKSRARRSKWGHNGSRTISSPGDIRLVALTNNRYIASLMLQCQRTSSMNPNRCVLSLELGKATRFSNRSSDRGKLSRHGSTRNVVGHDMESRELFPYSVQMELRIQRLCRSDVRTKVIAADMTSCDRRTILLAAGTAVLRPRQERLRPSKSKEMARV